MFKTLRGPLLALLLLLAWDASPLDLWAMRQVGDAGGFALREAWVTRGLIHEGGRQVSYAAMVFIVAVNVWPRLLPALTRRERTWWLVTTLVCLAVISLIKLVSLTSCPWDLAEFGGAAQYVSHWAFGDLAGGWALARAYPRAARTWLVAVVALGFVYGLGQMLRGAHYPSHTMWTGWICWAVTVAASVLFRMPSTARQ